MLPVKESLSCEGWVEGLEPSPAGCLATVALKASKADGTIIATGTAEVLLGAEGLAS